LCSVRTARPPRPRSLCLLLTSTSLACSSKSTGDPWLTDGSYLDGTGFARIGFEKQMSNTKRFDQELRLVSYNGILFFLKHQAHPPGAPHPPAPPQGPSLCGLCAMRSLPC
jgi:hypothetical protein